jgi:hypothetical protein
MIWLLAFELLTKYLISCFQILRHLNFVDKIASHVIKMGSDPDP